MYGDAFYFCVQCGCRLIGYRLGLVYDKLPRRVLMKCTGKCVVLELEQLLKKRGGWIMDHIQIKELEVFANHGVLKQENELGQKLLYQ